MLKSGRNDRGPRKVRILIVTLIKIGERPSRSRNNTDDVRDDDRSMRAKHLVDIHIEWRSWSRSSYRDSSSSLYRSAWILAPCEWTNPRECGIYISRVFNVRVYTLLLNHEREYTSSFFFLLSFSIGRVRGKTMRIRVTGVSLMFYTGVCSRSLFFLPHALPISPVDL